MHVKKTGPARNTRQTNEERNGRNTGLKFCLLVHSEHYRKFGIRGQSQRVHLSLNRFLFEK
jgi:hypothetical protein